MRHSLLRSNSPQIEGTDTMQVSVQTTNGLERKMTVEIAKEKVDSEVQTRLKSIASKAKLAGFRPGKVPMNVIESKYSAGVRQEVLGELIQSTYVDALKQENLMPAGMPQIEHKTPANGSDAIEYTATFEVYPDINLSDPKALEVEKSVVDITEQDINDTLETISKQHVIWSAVSRSAQLKDKVTMEFEGKIDGEVFEGGSGKDLSVELGSKQMIPGFEDQLVGVNVDEERDISLTFPESYHVKDLAGKPVIFHVKVTKIEEPELPELNDAFAETLGVKEGGVETLKAQVKANLQREVETKIKTKVKQQVMDALLANNEIEVPKVMVDNDIAQLRKQQQSQMGADVEIDANLLENQARRRVALGLILSEIIKQNELKVESVKFRKMVDSIAAGYETPEEVVKYYYSDKQRLAEIENLALEEEVIDWVLGNAKLVEKPTTFKELMDTA